MDAREEFAPAKINLFLHVTGRRADGYHLLDSLVVFAGVGDRIRFAEADDLSLTLTGPFAAALASGPDNLVLKAAHALARAMSVPARGALVLEKNIPVASGIGGGSADAAATLRLLCRAWGVSPDPATLHDIAAGLGADVPVCLLARPARMRGIGEILTQAPDPPFLGLLLVNPGVPVVTADVFRTRNGPFSSEATPSSEAAWQTAKAMADFLAGCANDLEEPSISLAPEIGTVLAAIRAHGGCLLARMSGSGATCFGLFASQAEAQAASTAIRRPDWWVWAGGLAG